MFCIAYHISEKKTVKFFSVTSIQGTSFTSTYLVQLAREKSCDYVLYIITVEPYTHREWNQRMETKQYWMSERRELNILGPLKTKRKFPFICPAVEQTEGILTSSLIWMYVTVKQNMSLKLFERKSFLLRYIILTIWSLVISSNLRIRNSQK